jgi:phosphomevalonate kinase
VIATAPGKLLVTGEYAVLDGAPALLLAVDRRVIASRSTRGEGSPFLDAVAVELAARYGAEHPAARTAREIRVDSSAFYDGTQKLGLGSSAAVTVTATALALGPGFDRDEVQHIAIAAHAAAQATRGVRGSGADIAAIVHGGAIAFTAGHVDRISWPDHVALIPFFTGHSADTVSLVAAITAARNQRPAEVAAALAAIAEASRQTLEALVGGDVIAALHRAATATDQLATATGVALVPACVTTARSLLKRFGGTAKTTGAGGGDIALGVIPRTADVTEAHRMLIEAGCQVLRLSLDDTGVDLRPPAQ